ncbi:Uncharacterized protein conserved in bacteria, NMA0228-like [hydrothermal vent metagenome]|uniref:Uncharacterized protein conserved in bacteria, NMA0228-like n=1 Tax=hydrothermal vent metagenome TaxID=652676 RepID=A0A3B0U244_9ZZZZ
MASQPQTNARQIPARAGVGLKADHYREILDTRPDLGFFEVHAENYMGAGGPPHRYLAAIAEHYPLSVHGVGLSIGGATPLDRDHLERLAGVVERYQPALVSEHLAWSTHTTGFLNDLLPLPYTPQTLARVVEHIDQVQSRLGRQILLENPSTYVVFKTSTMSEIEFIIEVGKRSGCGLLFDVNNVFVSCTNHRMSAEDYVDAYPAHLVGEIHLGGHAVDEDDEGATLLIDAHDREVIDDVWSLYARALRRTGPVPTLIEWDNNVPEWPVLFTEAKRAEAVMDEIHGGDTQRRPDQISKNEAADADPIARLA